MKNNKSFGFTLIELLIVIAIIAILAAIAIPNFLAAQVRSKVSRNLSDFRMLNLGLEAYFVDYNDYPPTRQPQPLSTPVAYISSFPKSPWKVFYWTGISEDEFTRVNNTYLYVSRWGFLGNNPADLQRDYGEYNRIGGLYPPEYNNPQIVRWELKSMGPDGLDDINEMLAGRITRACYYDPTNGIVSPGDIVWFNNGKGKR